MSDLKDTIRQTIAILESNLEDTQAYEDALALTIAAKDDTEDELAKAILQVLGISIQAQLDEDGKIAIAGLAAASIMVDLYQKVHDG